MNGARFVHDTLELYGWQVEIADAQKVKGLAPLACKTDRIDAWVRCWPSSPTVGYSASCRRARWRCRPRLDVRTRA
jgi:transposase